MVFPDDYEIGVPHTFARGTVGETIVVCPKGLMPVGGGVSFGPRLVNANQGIVLTSSAPLTFEEEEGGPGGGGSVLRGGWSAEAFNEAGPDDETMKVFAICAVGGSIHIHQQ